MTDNLPVRSAQSMEEALRMMVDEIQDLPPLPQCFRAHYDVPPGQIFRQWNTRGELEVWCNREQLERLPRYVNPKLPPDFVLKDPALLWGITIYLED